MKLANQYAQAKAEFDVAEARLKELRDRIIAEAGYNGSVIGDNLMVNTKEIVSTHYKASVLKQYVSQQVLDEAAYEVTQTRLTIKATSQQGTIRKPKAGKNVVSISKAA